MFKKIIAAALAAVAVAASAGVAFAAENYKPIVNGKQNYHYCNVGRCNHYYEGKYLGVSAVGSWGYSYSKNSNYDTSLKHISVTTYRYVKSSSNSLYSKIGTVYSDDRTKIVTSPSITVDGAVAKVVYNGKIYGTSELGSSPVEKYLIGSFKKGLPIK